MTATQNFSFYSSICVSLTKAYGNTLTGNSIKPMLRRLGWVSLMVLLIAVPSLTPKIALSFKTLDVTWTASLQDEVKVLAERFTGRPHDRPDLVASNCPDKSKDSICLRR